MLKGILALVGASVLLGVIPAANKFVLLSGMSNSCIVFLTYLTSMVGMGIISALQKKRFSVSARQLVVLLLAGAGGLGLTGYFLNIAYERIPVGLTTTLHFLYPTLVSCVMVVAFHQKMSKYKLGAIVLSVIGMVLIADLSGGSIQVTGVVVALLSSVTYSFYMIVNEKGCISGLDLFIKMFYISMGAAILFGILTLVNGELTLPGTSPVWGVLFGLIGIGSMLAFFLVTVGIRIIGASNASFLNMLEPLTSLAVGAVLYQEIPSVISVAGCGLVIVSVCLVALDGAKAPSA